MDVFDFWEILKAFKILNFKFFLQWAKINHIGDASQGSLSSYAWIIMLLYYLQTLRPFGLIPILQEV